MPAAPGTASGSGAEPAAAAPSGTASESGAGTAAAAPSGTASGSGGGSAAAAAPASSTASSNEPARPVPIAPSALELQRVAGNTDVQPSNQTRSTMIRNGVSGVKGTVRLCVDTTGSVTESKLTEATGYDEYDKKLVAAVRNWRFRPYVIGGQVFAVCSTAEFVYVPR